MLGDARVRLSIHPRAERTAAAPAIDRSQTPGPAPQRSFRAPVPNRATLANGLSVLHVEKHGLPTVAFGLVVRSGAASDPEDRAGLAHLTTSMLQEGTAKRTSSQISDDVEFIGSHLRAEASREHILLTSDGLASTWRDALEILGDIALHAEFPEHELERVRSNMLTDLRRVSDNPATISARATRGVILGRRTPYGHPLAGTEESIGTASRDDLTAYHGAHFRPGASTLIMVGELSLDEAISAAEQTFGGWKGAAHEPSVARDGTETTPSQTTIFLADKPGAAQSIIRTGHSTISRNDRNYMALNVLNYIFGGQFGARLNMNLRQDKGYSYGYMSSIDWNLGPSMLIAGGGVQTAVTKETVIETLKEFSDITGVRPVTTNEFRDAIAGILRAMPGQFETQHQIISQLTRLVAHDLPDDYLARFPQNLADVELDHVQQVASRLLDAQRLNVVIVGDASVVEPGLQELGLPIVAIDSEGRRL